MSGRALALLPVLLVLLAVTPAPTQGIKADKGKKFALLVGVKTYQRDGLADLQHTEKDVEQLGEVLRDKGGFTTVTLTDSRGKKDSALKPTAKNIREQLKKLTDKVTKHDLL